MKEKINDAGVLYTFELDSKKVYALSSKKGTYRGGKKRSKPKTFAVISGVIESITHQDGKDHKKTISAGTLHTIPAGVPHLVYFPEDAAMIEWWDGEYLEEKYQPFYSLKNH